MTQIVYLGSEIGSNRLLLESMNVKRVGFSFWRASRRGLPKKTYYLSERFDSDVDIYVDWWNPLYDLFGPSEKDAYDAAYVDFLQNNADYIKASVFHDDLYVGQSIAEWDGKSSIPNADIVGIPGSLIENNPSLAAKVRMAKVRSNTTFMALGTAKPDNLRQIPFDLSSTLAWLSPMRRGETIIWDGRSLVRYPKSMQNQARKRYKGQITRAGLSFDKFLADDNKEVARATIWSFQMLEEDITRKRGKTLLVTDSGYGDDAPLVEPEGVDVDNRGEEVCNDEAPVLANTEDDTRSLLPGLSVSLTPSKSFNADGAPITTDVPALGITSASLRICDTCFVAATCPAFKAGNKCAFKIPVEIRTKEQQKALFTALIEMQTMRVLFARFAEEQNGGYPDPNLSLEMDRLLAQMDKIKKIESDVSTVKVSIEAQGSSGMLASIFGEQAKKPALPAPMSEHDVSLMMADIVDAEIID